jgi:hypothetical protein
VSPSWAQLIVDAIPVAGHDRGLHQRVPHCVKWGGGLQPPLSQETWNGGSAHSCHNNTMDGECSGHSGHDDGSIADSGTAAGYRSPLQATTCSLGGVANASKQLLRSSHMCHHGTSPRSRQRGS